MTRLRMLLNAPFSGPQAWLLLALRRGHLAAAGIELDLTQGNGAYNAAPGVAAGGYDLGYGDVHALLEIVARDAARAPIGIFATFNASPAAIALRQDGPLRTPADLLGRCLIGHASDVALRCFPAFAAATGLDLARVRIAPAEGSMAALAARLQDGSADGLFCYMSTLTAALAAGGRDAAGAVRWLRYDRLVPDLYGSVVMASRRLVRDEPALLARLVRAINRGLAEALAEPAAAIEAVRSFAPDAHAAVELLRWETTLAVEMAHPEARLHGYGGVDPARFARGLRLHARSIGLADPPAPDAVFTAQFLPPPDQRARPA